MRLVNCKTCNKEARYAGKEICTACYQKKRCETPELLEIRRKQRRESYRRCKGLPVDHVFPPNEPICETCKKEIDNDTRMCRNLCNPCYRKNYRKNSRDTYTEKIKIARRLKRGLPPDHPRLIAKNGSGYIHKKSGYKTIYKPNHPNIKNKMGQILEHVFVMSQYLGRPLFRGETVHHKNGIRHDNRIENLEIWDKSHPPGQRLQDKINWCKEFLERHGYKITN